MKITVAEKDGPRTVSTYKRCLLSEVGPIARDHDLAGDMALATFTSQTVNPAMARAQTALFED